MLVFRWGVVMYEFQRIPMETLRTESVVAFSVYRCDRRGIEPVALPNNLFSYEIFSFLQREGVVDLYIRRNEMDRYLNYIDLHCCSNISGGVTDTPDKRSLVSGMLK